MRAYLITSTEYKYNEPDRFIMDENGNYYGVGEHSYAIFHNFPKSIDYWMSATCSDSDRFFDVVSVELNMEQLEAFDSITKEYINHPNSAPVFGEQYPDGMSNEWKSKKAYNAAVEEWMKRHDAWVAENRNNIIEYRERERELSQERKRMFASFSENKGGVA